jgi:hypothetical protein
METLEKTTGMAARPVGPFWKLPSLGGRERLALNERLDRAIVVLMVAIALVLAAPLGVLLVYQRPAPAVQTPAPEPIPILTRPLHKTARPTDGGYPAGRDVNSASPRLTLL